MSSAIQSESRKSRIIPILREVLEETSGIEINEFDGGVTFFEMGMDSLYLTQVSMALSKKFNLKINFRQLLEDYTNLEQLSNFIDTSLPPEALPAINIATSPSIAVAPVNVPIVNPVAYSPSPANAAPLSTPTIESFGSSATAGTMEHLISQQLQLMARQIEALGGATTRMSAPIMTNKNVTVSSEIQPKQTTVIQPECQINTKALPEEAPKPFGAIAKITLTKDNVLSPHQIASLESITNRYISRTIGSKRLAQANRSFLAEPRVVSGFSPLLKEIVYPIHVNRSSGCRLWDVDGNEYIDMLCGFGSNFFGNVPQFITDAIRTQLDNGMEIGPIHTLAGEVGKLFCEMTKSERVAFCNTGSEAVLGAMRVARTVTGRSKIAIFANSYHGIFDEVIVRGSKKLRTTPAAPGIMSECVQNVIVLDYGTPESLEIIRQKAKDGELAAVLCEPVQSRHPALQPSEFLHEVRKITEETDTALIFDEVITGFRIGQGGAQEYFGVKADLATYGKVIGGGLPIGVIAGRKKWMDALDGGFWSFGDASTPEAGVTYFAGTFVRHPLALSAAKAVLIYLKEKGPELHKGINERTTLLVGELNTWFIEVGAPIHIEHFATQMKIIFTQELPYSELLTTIMRTKGIHILDGFPFFLSLAHTEEDIAFASRVFKEAVLEMQEADFMPGKNLFQDKYSDTKKVYPLTVPSTESQREIWTSSQMGEDASLAFNEALSVRFRGNLDLPALRKSIHILIQRHDSLRATLSNDGTRLNVSTPQEISVDECDLSEMSHDVADQTLLNLLNEAVLKPFNLERGPLFRVNTVRMSDDDHLLILAAHHIICDGWSYAVMLRELGTLYSAIHSGTEPELAQPDSFSSYSLAMSTREQNPDFETDEKFWLDKFSHSISLLDIPLDKPRPKRKTYTSLREDYLLPSDLVQTVKKAGAKQGCSFFVIMLAAFKVLLHRLSGQEEIVLGIPSAGQSAVAKYNLVGHCVNTLPISSFINSENRFTEFLTSVKKNVLDAQDHQQYTYGTLLKKLKISRDPGRLPLVSVLFNIDQSLDPDSLGFSDLTTTIASTPRHYENFEIFVNAVENKGNVILEVQFNSDLYSSQTIRERFACFETLLKGIVKNPDSTISQLPILPDEQKYKILVEWNATESDFPSQSIFTELISQQSARTPDAVAVEFENQIVTYRELEERSNRLANLLRDNGIGRGSLVGLFIDRSVGMLVSLLATIKSGGAYVPLDPGFPQDRIAYMLENSGACVVISQEQLLSVLPENKCQIILIDDSGNSIDATNADPIVPVSGPEDPAYIIYTSGSTGKPKGVVVPHRGVTNFLCSMAQSPGINSNDVLLAVTTLSFDIAVLELYLPLITGAKVVIASRDAAMDGMELLELIQKTDVTIMQATPATWRMLIASGWDKSSAFNKNFKVLVGGEALSRDLADQLVERTGEVWNMYGPTETTVWSTCHPVRDLNSTIVVGRPIANTQLYILDSKLQPVPVGVPGELLIGGSGVALGYWQLPTMTDERFINNPFFDPDAKYPSPKLYKTGDLARYMPDGTVDFIGRNDNQVKVRGYRIELGEIEYVLMKTGLLHECVVTVREDVPGDQRIVAYYVLGANASISTAKDAQALLKAEAQKSLPTYMIPHHWIALPALPKTLNGKIDRKPLPAPGGAFTLQSQTVHKAPETARQKQIFGIWQEVLKTDDFGIDEDFFQLGGHSLLVAQIIARIQRAGLKPPTFRDLFTMPTVEKLAQWIDEHSETSSVHHLKVTQREDREKAPLSLMQQRIWYMEQITPGTPVYNLPAAFRFHGKLDTNIIIDCWQALFDRHSALRTYFDLYDGLPIQRILPEFRFNLPLAKCTLEQVREIMNADALIPFELSTAPLLRAKLFELGPDDHVLYFVVHHAIWDGWGFDIFMRDFKELYEAKSAGRPVQLPILTFDYADYAIWHRQRIETGGILDTEKQYWYKRLEGRLPILELPRDYDRPEVMTFHGDMAEFSWSSDYVRTLNSFAKQHGCTLQMLLLAVYKILLHQLTGMNDLIVGAPIQGRTMPEVEDVIGFFVNTLVLRTKIDDESLTFSDVIARVRETCLDAYAHQNIPFEVLVEELKPPRDFSRTPIFQNFFTYQDVTNRQYSIGDLPITQINVKNSVVASDINLWLRVGNSGLAGAIDYSTDLFKRSRIESWLELYRQILEKGISNPGVKISELPKDVSRTTSRDEATATKSIQILPVTKQLKPLVGTPEEQYLVTLWKQVLKTENVAISDNFFDIGGHSLLSIELIAQIQRETGYRLSPRTILLDTLGQIAQQLRNNKSNVSNNMSSRVDTNKNFEAFYFNNGKGKLFGMLHHPTQSNNVNAGILICAPIAQEYMRTHWIFRQITDALTKSGLYVLRFDYSGCGDSSGDNFEGGVNQWVSDTQHAEQVLRNNTGVNKTITLAARFGAVIAAKANLNTPLVLWDPVEDGSQYLKELEHLTQEKHLSSQATEKQWDNNLVGFEFKPELRAEIEKLSLSDSLSNSSQNPVIFSSKDLAEPVKWSDVNSWSAAILSNEVVKSITKTILFQLQIDDDIKAARIEATEAYN